MGAAFVLFFLLILALGGVSLYRAARFTAPPIPRPSSGAAPLRGEPAAQRLAGALRFATLSDRDPGRLDAEPFRRFQAFLESSFPRVYAALELERVNQLSLLFTWRGSDESQLPILLMAHQDVVPVAPGTEGDWSHPPFAGAVADGYVWGRGALDVKSGLMGIFEAVEALLAEGWRPPRTVYLAFGHDEEVGGAQGAAKIAALLGARGVRLALVLDEGGAVLEDGLPGVPGPLATVGVAERGFVNLELTARGRGGHASMPGSDAAISVLSRALVRLERRPFVADPGFLIDTYRHLAERLTPGYRLLFANLPLLGPLVTQRLGATPKLNAGLRTTVAPTMVSGGVQANVLPGQATANLNIRIFPGQSVAGVLERVRRVVADPRVEVRQVGPSSEPSPVSDSRGRAFGVLGEVIRQASGDPDLPVAPYLVVGATDSRYYAPLAENTFRFLLNRLGNGDFQRIHGTDERISVANYAQVVAFYAQVLRRSGEF
ncbi:peptidase M20 [Desulfuromonas versatilis]|uniref:Peptidase M20 n=1 Tax=Desulfuromonas versatilis TaxID=2802975 RepID=A0ABM8HMS6_9BACT|nr:M20 family peptidase [Desulfuromonas versatilis]BCR03631.1 peptidase M20 [Desulfuromonas versatilis]